jgi:hypothetical protein
MNMIRHENCRDHCPIPNASRDLDKRGKRLIVCEHRTSALHAKGNEINHGLIKAEQYRNPRGMSHTAMLFSELL